MSAIPLPLSPAVADDYDQADVLFPLALRAIKFSDLDLAGRVSEQAALWALLDKAANRQQIAAFCDECRAVIAKYGG